MTKSEALDLFRKAGLTAGVPKGDLIDDAFVEASNQMDSEAVSILSRQAAKDAFEEGVRRNWDTGGTIPDPRWSL